jgi:hypothetical protein
MLLEAGDLLHFRRAEFYSTNQLALLRDILENPHIILSATKTRLESF